MSLRIRVPTRRLGPDVYTIHIVKDRIGAIKNPGWFEPAGVCSWSFPGRFDVRAFRRQIPEGLRHWLPTFRGERIATANGNMRGIRAQAQVAVPAAKGKGLPIPCGGEYPTRLYAKFVHRARSIRPAESLSTVEVNGCSRKVNDVHIFTACGSVAADFREHFGASSLSSTPVAMSDPARRP